MKWLSRRGLLLVLGLLVFLLPWIGIPLSQKFLLAHILGLLIIMLSFRVRRGEESPMDTLARVVHPDEPAYVDNSSHFSYKE